MEDNAYFGCITPVAITVTTFWSSLAEGVMLPDCTGCIPLLNVKEQINKPHHNKTKHRSYFYFIFNCFRSPCLVFLGSSTSIKKFLVLECKEIVKKKVVSFSLKQANSVTTRAPRSLPHDLFCQYKFLHTHLYYLHERTLLYLDFAAYTYCFRDDLS